MGPAAGPPTTAPPPDPVTVAARDPAVLGGLRLHAAARLRVLLADKPVPVRDQEADDAVGDAISRGLAKWREFDPAVATPAGWLHGILHRVLSERCRRLRKQPAQPSAHPADWDALVARHEGDDTGAELADLLERLPVGPREAVVAIYIEGLSHADLGRRLGITPVAARVRLSRAMAELRRIAADTREGDR